MSDEIIYQIEDHTAILTLNRPDQLNAMDVPMGKAFGKIMKDIQKNKKIHVAILTGAGRAFSSGGNLEMLEAKVKKTPAQNKKELIAFYKSFLDVRKLRVPVIAAINGHAVGAGFCLSLACDLRYASETAVLSGNFARIGLAPGMGGTYLITRLLGPAKAAEVMLLAENLSAQRSLQLGLVNEVVSPDNLMSRVREVANTIASNGPVAINMIKQGIQKAMHGTLEQLFIYDSTCQAKCFASKDIKEGILAIREKRKPVFTGQ